MSTWLKEATELKVRYSAVIESLVSDLNDEIDDNTQDFKSWMNDFWREASRNSGLMAEIAAILPMKGDGTKLGSYLNYDLSPKYSPLRQYLSRAFDNMLSPKEVVALLARGGVFSSRDMKEYGNRIRVTSGNNATKGVLSFGVLKSRFYESRAFKYAPDPAARSVERKRERERLRKGTTRDRRTAYSSGRREAVGAMRYTSGFGGRKVRNVRRQRFAFG